MKQITLLMAAVLFLGISCFAQNDGKIKTLRDNIARSNEDIQNAKKSVAVKTWMDRGKLFQDAYNVNVGFLRMDMSNVETRMFFNAPKEITTSEEAGISTEIHVYDNLKLYFENGALKRWEELQPVVANSLEEAIKAYQKATTLDAKGRNEKRISDAYKVINGDLESRFFNEYSLAKYKDAYSTALQRIDLGKIMGAGNDTVNHYLAGFAAFAQSEIDSSMWQSSVESFEKAIENGYKEYGDNQGQIYHLLYVSCTNAGTPEKALQYARTGFEKHSNYIQLMYDLINYYLSRKENTQALNYLEQAVARDPQNANLLYAQGSIFDELNEPEKALASYDKAIAVNPQYFDAYYNKAIVYYNAAAKLMEEANAETTTAGYEAKKNLADDEVMKAIPIFEKALELRPDEQTVMSTLSSLYFRMRTKFPEMEAKYNELQQKLQK